MDPVNIRSNARSVLGLAAVSLAVAAVVAYPRSPAPEPERAWQPPAGYVIVDTLSLAGDRALRLWTGPSGWWVESVKAGRHEAAVGAASGGSDEYSASEVLDGLVGYVPVAGTRTVSVGSDAAAVRKEIHAGIFLVPASVVSTTDPAVLVTPFDAAGRPLAEETAVPIAGRG